MKRIIASFAAVAALALVPAAASAQSFSPAPGSVATGKLYVNQYLSGTCDVVFNIGISSSGDAAWISAADFGAGSPCSALNAGNLDWPIHFNYYSGTDASLTIKGLRVQTSAGWCQGDVDIILDTLTGDIEVPYQLIDGKIFSVITANCALETRNGDLKTNPPVSV